VSDHNVAGSPKIAGMNDSGASTLIVFGLTVTAAIAVMMLVGARRRWRWMVDPPLRLWIAHPYALLRYFFGETAVVWVVYVTAIVTLLFSVYAALLVFGLQPGS
jgi:hypothetical protein